MANQLERLEIDRAAAIMQRDGTSSGFICWTKDGRVLEIYGLEMLLGRKPSRPPKKNGPPAVSTGQHRCPKCDKEFQTKQALATHYHWHDRKKNK